MKALTVRQPWAWLIIYGGKDIENRGWHCLHRGPLAIHAARGMRGVEYTWALNFVAEFDRALAERIPQPADLARGAVIGTVLMRDCVRRSESPWFEGKLGFVLASPVPLSNPVAARGALGLWDWNEDAR